MFFVCRYQKIAMNLSIDLERNEPKQPVLTAKKKKSENLRYSKYSETLQLESLKKKSNIWKAQDSLL